MPAGVRSCSAPPARRAPRSAQATATSSEESDDLATLLFTCVGVPEYASRAGGGPGAPIEIRPVAERFKDE